MTSGRMRAAYLVAPQRLELRDDSVPVPEPGGIVVRVRVALTDGTDLKAFRRGHPQMPMPTRFGHEFSGDVAAVGAGVEKFKPGDGVMSVHTAPCLACAWCARGEEQLCERIMPRMVLGAYAEYLALPPHIVANNAFPKPRDLPYEAAAFLEPLSCVVHSFDSMALPEDASLVVIGDGGFGLLHALVGKVLLGREPILIGRRTERLALAAQMGLTQILNARELDQEQRRRRVLEATEGRGADAVVECTGTQAVWESAPSFARRGGIVTLFAGLPSGTQVSYDAGRLHYEGVRLLSPFHFTRGAVARAWALLLERKLDVLRLISGRYPLERVADAFAALDRGEGMKFAIVPELAQALEAA